MKKMISQRITGQVEIIFFFSVNSKKMKIGSIMPALGKLQGNPSKLYIEHEMSEEKTTGENTFNLCVEVWNSDEDSSKDPNKSTCL